MQQWDDVEFAFTLKEPGNILLAHCDGRTVLQCGFENGAVQAAVRYSYAPDVPLRLAAQAKAGDAVRLHLLPWRIELYINGALQDEEWPCGGHYLAGAEFTPGNTPYEVYTPAAITREQPCVLGQFTGAEGWRPQTNIFVGDCMPYAHNGVYHVIYLKDRRHHASKWGKGAHQWSHISTADMHTWSIHPDVVEIDDPAEGSICTGSWILCGDTHYLYYTVRTCDGTPAPICRSFSHDGYHYSKDKDFRFELSAKYTGESARDPKVLRDEQGIYHMFLTTTLVNSGRGCLAHLVSPNLHTWREEDEPIYVAPEGMGEPECCDYFTAGGWYYLVYSLHGRGYYLYARRPFGPWQMPDDPIIPCEAVPKAAPWGDGLVFAGFKRINGYAGTLTFTSCAVRDDGQLVFGK